MKEFRIGSKKKNELIGFLNQVLLFGSFRFSFFFRCRCFCCVAVFLSNRERDESIDLRCRRHSLSITSNEMQPLECHFPQRFCHSNGPSHKLDPSRSSHLSAKPTDIFQPPKLLEIFQPITLVSIVAR